MRVIRRLWYELSFWLSADAEHKFAIEAEEVDGEVVLKCRSRLCPAALARWRGMQPSNCIGR